MSSTLTPAPPGPPDVDPLEALIKEARRRARRRRALYGVSALCAAGAVAAGFYGFDGGGGHAQARGTAKPASPGSPQQTRPSPSPRAVKNGPLALIDGRNPDRIFLIGPRGRFFRSLPICKPPRCGEITSAAWSPDGRTLAYGTASGPYWHKQDGLHLFDLTTNKDRRVPAGYGNWQDVAWSPDGTKLASVDAAGIQITRLARPQQTTVLTAAGTSPSWSPNGKLIAYDRYHDSAVGQATWGISVRRADGSHVRRLSKWGHSPVWSPDGSLIAYSAPCGIRLMRRPAGTSRPSRRGTASTSAYPGPQRGRPTAGSSRSPESTAYTS